MKNIIIGTAGHIDHGKTTLIKYMTGIDTDRLPEEKEKNMTIDIGFSHFQEKNINIGIVDVPGHQKFIKNMLSGVAGINYILFIVSCDDGVMPQTIEHFEILKLLGIKNGIIVLTKKDLVTEERVEEVKKELRKKFKGSFLESFEIMETSIKDIKSYERLKEKIVEDILKLEERVEEKEFLMYIDRSFSIKGYGTVVTGSVLSGELGLGENIYLYPQKEKLKVKSIERFGEKVETLESNIRGAINLSGVDYKDIKRGNFLYSKEDLKPTNIIDVYFTFLDEEKIKSNQRVRVYFGTDEV
ncbi:selenocysteine-specific translation elongation factor, partial [Fusobacterium sp.]|uniref:selenocysteine-specific translation elongation factor n=1 Tax=Fusobacterium sp. TaxID=68766 RepID=UPI002609FB9F